MPARGGKVKSVKDLKKSIKAGSGGRFLNRVPADGALTVRFLTEPNEWVEFYMHYLGSGPTADIFPCSDGDCRGCAENDSPSKAYAACAVDVDESRSIGVQMTKTLAESVLKRYDKYGTLLDRDYELLREGSGFDTKYDSIPEAPRKMNLTRFEAVDLWGIIEGMLAESGQDDADDDLDDDDEDDAPRKPSRGGKPTRTKSSSKANIRTEDDDDEDEDDDEDDEPVRPVRRKAPVRRSTGTTKSAAPSRGLKKKPATTTPARRTMRRG